MAGADTILTLKDGRVVLLSEYEADKLLPLWRNPTSPRHATLQHLCMVVDSKNRRGFGRNSISLDASVFTSLVLFCDYMNSKNRPGFGRDSISVDTSVLTSLKLFRGYVHFSLDERKNLTAMFETIQARGFLQNLLSIRGRLRYFDRSDLDDFSTVMGG